MVVGAAAVVFGLSGSRRVARPYSSLRLGGLMRGRSLCFLVVFKSGERYRYYGREESEFYGFMLRADLGIESYREEGRVLVRGDDAAAMQFRAFYKFLVDYIESTSPYTVE